MKNTLPDCRFISLISGFKSICVAAIALLLVACVENTATTTDGSKAGNPPGNNEPAKQPTLTLSATPTSIAYGATASLVWSSANADRCEGSGAWSGAISASGNIQTEALTSDRTYTLTCTGTGGTIVASASISVSAPVVMPDIPVITFSAEPTSVAYLATAMLTWSSMNATTCTASGAWSGNQPTSGTATLPSLATTGTYTLACTGSGGSSSESVTIAVQAAPAPAPAVTFNANPTSVAYNGSSTFTWSTTNATSCTASDAWSGGKTTSGTQTLSALISTGTYTLTCSGAGGSASKSVAITVSPAAAPTVTFGASPTSVAYNGSATLTWSSTNATSCNASGAWSGAKLTSGTAALSSLTTTGTYTLTCSGAGGSASQPVTITVTAPPTPEITLYASPTAVAYNGSTTVTWSITNATSCSASGGWSGNKATSGTQTFSALTATTTYSLACSGAGGSASQSATVTVQAAPAPTVSLSANPASVAYNGGTTLTWSSANATSCTASGAWSGAKATSGTMVLAALTSSGNYTLSCSGAGGSVNQSVAITVVSGTSGTVTGYVDSSRINRNGANKVYLYNGTATPDDYDGDSGDPIASATVNQDDNACTFSYTFNDVVPGTYTIAFTSQAAIDIAGQNDAISFVGTSNITAGAGSTAKNIGAARLLQVGSGKSFASPGAAYAAAQAGDVIEIDAGTYLDDVVVWRQNNLTLRGVGGRAHMKSTKIIPYDGSDAGNGMAIWVTRGSNMVVENMEFSGATVPDENGAGIRAEGNGLTVCGSYFHDNQDGILGGAGVVLIEYSEFQHNGINGDGFTHNLYMDSAVSRLIFRHNYSHRAHIGHELKSRAVENHILYNRLMNEDGDGSYTIDVPNGGLTYIIGNLIQQGPNTDNSTMVNYGAEGLSAGRTHQLYLINNTLVNDRSGGTFVVAASGTTQVQVTNNLFVGAGTDVSGPSVTKTANLAGSSADVTNRAGYDYHLTSASPAINLGADPGLVNGFDLRPVYQYVDKANRSVRPSSGNYDIGAYEYTP